uniref:HTH CENPB-type domain-containing protein n=1 Tax=Tetranychus urticae TaxID=32264 RepID=T1JUY4_TETUR
MDFNPANVLILCKTKLNQEYPNLQPTQPTIEEKLFANAIYSQIIAKSQQRLIVEEELCLDYNDDADSDDDCSYDQPTSISSSQPEPMEVVSSSSSQETASDEPSSEEQYEAPSTSSAADTRVSASTIQKIVDHTQQHSWGQAAKRYRKSKSFIQDIVESQRKGGSKQAKLEKIRDHCQLMFAESRRNGNIIHYWNLQEWARVKASEVGLQDFKASANFLHKFKKANNIVSRKVTKFVTRREIAGEAEILETAKAFMNMSSILAKRRLNMN